MLVLIMLRCVRTLLFVMFRMSLYTTMLQAQCTSIINQSSKERGLGGCRLRRSRPLAEWGCGSGVGDCGGSGTERKYRSMSDLSNSGGSVEEGGDRDGGDGGSDGWSCGGLDPPILYVRFRLALTGGRSGIICDAFSVLGGTLRTVKCERERVYGESVWLEWESVDSWEMVLFNAGRRMTGSVECVDGELEPQLSKWRFMLDEETESRRLEREDLRGM